MRKIQFYSVVFLLCAINATAQATKVDRTYGPKITVRPATQAPVWAKAAPANVNYYYLPDLDTYYDVPAKRYIYMNNGTWVKRSTLPTWHKGYNMANSNPVYLTDYKGRTPYKLYKVHKVKYKGKGRLKSNGHANHHRGKGKKK